MTNPIYSHASGVPVSQTRGTSSAVRAEFDLVATAFDIVSSSVLGIGIESGSGNAFVLTLTPVPAVMPTRGTFVFLATHSNTGASTLQLGALTVIPLLANDGSALTSNYITAGELICCYTNGTNAYLLGATKSYVDNTAFSSAVPAQGGNAGKVLITNGSSAFWGSFSNLWSVGAGTVENPSFNLGDSSTGNYRPALNQFALAINGVVAELDQSSGKTLYGNLVFGTGITFPANMSQLEAQTAIGSPSFDGLGALGTWGISITGNAATATNITGGTVAILNGGTGATTAVAAQTALGITTRNIFLKANTSTVAFTKTAAGTASLKAGTYVDVAGTLQTFAAATAITMPVLIIGTDYAIYACADGSLRADANFSAPTGYTTANSRKIGGFHYSPGGHSGAPGGGDTTPQINVYSLWDLKFKPACTDPRGMALVAGGFWADIYMLGVDHQVNGTSKYNVTIADGASPPKVPTSFGGNGSTAYGSLTWWEAGEVLAGYGKRRPNYGEFSALAYGTTEATSIGADPVTTTWAAAYISKWGCAQVSGTMWQWGADLGGGAAAAVWVVNTGGRGSTYQLENAVIFGASWTDSSDAGSRCAFFNDSPSVSYYYIGARGVCGHLILE